MASKAVLQMQIDLLHDLAAERQLEIERLRGVAAEAIGILRVPFPSDADRLAEKLKL